LVNKKYLYPALPTGATPVPEDKYGYHHCGDFEFYYRGWTNDNENKKYQSGSTRDNPFPEERRGSLLEFQ
jgi:hypothetical protein